MPYSPKTHKQPNVLHKREDRANYDKKRACASERGYDAAWRKVRLHHLTDKPICEDCMRIFIFSPATEVHHIKKLADYPELRDDSSNLLSLCKRCHSVRTAKGE